MCLEPLSSAKPVLLPLACVLDVFCNIYNTNEPAALDVVTEELMPLVFEDQLLGRVVGLDEMLDLLTKVPNVPWSRKRLPPSPP